MSSTVYIGRGTIDFSFIIVRRGDWVVLKPNLVKESKENDPGEWRSVVTSPELIEQVCCYVCEQLSGEGRVTICDAPQTDSSFATIAERLGLNGIASRCSSKYGVTVEVVDLRMEEWTNEEGMITGRRRLPGDPNGTVAFDLGRESLFYRHTGEGRYYGADYDSGVVNLHHQGERHEYLLCATPILADVFINLPKLKTHKKTGVTLSLKNLVGINADKNWLPHHSEGSPADGGDQFPDLTALRKLEQHSVGFVRSLALRVPVLGPHLGRKLRKAGRQVFGDTGQVVRSGNWYGNDTTWRMVLDLNRCLLYGNSDGSMRSNNPKRYYSVVDGLVGMDGNGPMQGEPVECGIVIGGGDPAAVDAVATRVMGFDWRKVPVVRESFGLKTLPVTRLRPCEIRVESSIPGWSGWLEEFEVGEYYRFRPHFGWLGHIEYERQT